MPLKYQYFLTMMNWSGMSSHDCLASMVHVLTGRWLSCCHHLLPLIHTITTRIIRVGGWTRGGIGWTSGVGRHAPIVGIAPTLVHLLLIVLVVAMVVVVHLVLVLHMWGIHLLLLMVVLVVMLLPMLLMLLLLVSIVVVILLLLVIGVHVLWGMWYLKLILIQPIFIFEQMAFLLKHLLVFKWIFRDGRHVFLTWALHGFLGHCVVVVVVCTFLCDHF